MRATTTTVETVDVFREIEDECRFLERISGGWGYALLGFVLK